MSNDSRVAERATAIEQLFKLIPGGDALIQTKDGQVVVHYDPQNTGILQRQPFQSFQDALEHFRGLTPLSA